MNDPAAGEAKAVEETAKAVQEVAKISGQAIEATREAGGFLAKLFGGTLEQAIGIMEDRLRYARWERRCRLLLRARTFAREYGQPEPTRQIPTKILLPLLENGALEQEDELQDVWARMLVNAADADSAAEVRRAYISILADCTSLDIRNLATLYKGGRRPVRTAFLPGDGRPLYEGTSEEQPLSAEVERSLWNLRRLGLIAPVMTYADGSESMMTVNITALGVGFVEACTLRDPRNPV